MIVVTGIGLVTAASNCDQFFDSVFDLVSLHRDIRLEPGQSLRYHKAAFTESEEASLPAESIKAGRLDPFSLYALVAADQAAKQARLQDRGLDPARIAVIIGTANGGLTTTSLEIEKLITTGRRPHPLSIPKIMGNGAASAVSAHVGAKGFVTGITSACASGAQAIALGHELIRSGQADIAIVGGTDACNIYPYLKGWESLGVVSPEICRPFDTKRQGLSLGDGAGILVLERFYQEKDQDNPMPLAAIMSHGMSADAQNGTAPNKGGMVAAMSAALQKASLQPSDIGYINAHGTGTVQNDICEAQAIAAIFSDHQKQPLVSSTKPIHGHAMGATGAIEAIVAIETLKRSSVPGTWGLEMPDPACPINLAIKSQDLSNLSYVMTNSFAFGGINCCLILGAI